MSRYVVGIDVGTESVRAAVFDSEGRISGTGTAEITTVHPRPGWAEQAVEQWSICVATAVRSALAEGGVAPDDVAAVCADGTTCTVVFLDSDGKPLRSSLLWMDVRSGREAAEISATADESLAVTGGGTISSEWLAPKLLWTLRHEPAVLDQASTVCELTDWLAFEMCGEVASSLNTASMRGLYNDERWKYPRKLYESVGLGGVSDKLPARVLAPGTVVGVVTTAFARESGLRRGTPVTMGVSDAAAGMLGMGIAEPGRVGIVTGSSHVHLALVKKSLHVSGLFGTYPNGLVPGCGLLEGGQVSTGSILRWFTSHFAGAESQRRAEREGVTVLELLSEEAAAIPAGSQGLLVLDHFQGNRTPWTDAESRGVIRGLTLSHRPAHIARAIMEGVAYGTALVVRRMETAGVPAEALAMSGGAMRSKLWMQIHADVVGKPIQISANTDAPLLGSAMLASVGAGIHPDIATAAARMSRIARTIQPNAVAHDQYGFLVEQYEQTYHALRDVSRRLVRYTADLEDRESPTCPGGDGPRYSPAGMRREQ